MTNSIDNTHLTSNLEREIANLIVSTLNLEVASEHIDPNLPLYGDGLGLDSIDILELALAVSKQYGFQIKSDDPENKTIFSSLRHLAAYIAANRTK
ncbi:acyl carrier protein [Nitrosomonas sp. JL21]|uniref:phosphopantetheine-binding protein n=1 Tax=Nitrosomonas sp. JL21 TaxID=153949 RepID=UPI00136CDA72|nr:phosphopantetheine-binding protein [Nitrosomonas sp. JL21]MBL8498126.1 acyl carrier protein [Nitrosomonas sp.]MCC7090707.1 acyl carrier protein [Nitrosomonas sp.]MXS76360.1 acyl carrier protein [Nitrosomonas sp. JL21]